MAKVAVQLIIMLIYILLGLYLRKVRKMSADTQHMISLFIMNLTMPCTIIGSFMEADISISIRKIFIMLGISALTYLACIILAAVSCSLLALPPGEKGVWEFMLIFSNNIYIGFPVIRSYLGSNAIVYATINCIICNALIFSYGCYLIGKGSEQYSFSPKKMINTCSFASVIALLIVVLQLHFPKPAVELVTSLGNMTTPLALIVIGLALAEGLDKTVILRKKTIAFMVLELLIMPAFVWLVLLPVPENYTVYAQMLIITMAMPASNIALVMCEQYNSETKVAANYVVLSTLISLITIPIVCLVLC